MIQRLELKDFTVFKSLEIDFSPGVNIFIGENGTGKTHVLKFLYSVIASCFQKIHPGTKLNNVFKPEASILRLVRRELVKPIYASFTVDTDSDAYAGEIFKSSSKPSLFSGFDKYLEQASDEKFLTRPIFIPTKELLADAAGFISLSREWKLTNSAVEVDFVSTVLLPPRQTTNSFPISTATLKQLQTAIGGQVVEEDQRFYIKDRTGLCEFSLSAEGHRRLAALLILIQKNLIDKDTILFWDEPENNMNPKLLMLLVEVLLELQRGGVQIFLATHSYVLLKLFDLLKQKKDHIQYHLLKFIMQENKKKKVEATRSDDYLGTTESAISEMYLKLYDMEIKRAFAK